MHIQNVTGAALCAFESGGICPIDIIETGGKIKYGNWFSPTILMCIEQLKSEFEGTLCKLVYALSRSLCIQNKNDRFE
jgi:hypothetical protein